MRFSLRLIGILLLLILFTACSSDDVTPHERFDTYVNKWNKQKFTEMYDMLTTEAGETYEAEQFIDRYNKIYEDFNVTDLEITYKELSDEDLETAMKEGTATLPFKVDMQTIAGPITFDYEATLIQEGKKEDKSWFVNWDPGFIFPEIKEAGEIKIVSEEPKRGEILDRNKMPLAINDLVYEVGIVPEKLGDNEDNIKKEVARLLNISVEDIDAELDADWVEPDLFVPLKRVPKTKDEILNQLWELDSVTGRDVTGRVYPSGKAAAHLVGYIGQITGEELEELDSEIYRPSDEIGKRGLELLYEDKLKGERGVQIVVVYEDEENVVLAEKPVKDGENISVTIDANVQDYIYNSYDGEAGTAAAIDPKTGETLALVSSPSFDPNELLFGISEKQWETLQDDPQTPLINRFSNTYAPGSVIKPITAAIGLKNESLKAEEGLEIEGHTWSNGKGWGDYKVRRVSTSNKPVDLADAMQRSDNIYFAMQAVRMGIDSYTKGLKEFGFGEKIPFEYPLTNSTISSDGKLDGEVQLANTSYGQAQIEMSSLHLALSYTPFLNEGKMVKPTLLTSEESGEGWHEELVTPDQAKLMQEILRNVVTDGTAKSAKRDSLEISGKTGTAELKSSSEQKGRENGWFIGYPTKDQDILIAMMMESVENKGASGFVAEHVADILEKIKKSTP